MMVDHSGAVRVSGLVRRDNKECYVYGFYDEPYSLIKLPANNYRNVNTNNVSGPSSISPLAFSLYSPTLSSSSSSFSSSCIGPNTTATAATKVKVININSDTKKK